MQEKLSSGCALQWPKFLILWRYFFCFCFFCIRFDIFQGKLKGIMNFLALRNNLELTVKRKRLLTSFCLQQDCCACFILFFYIILMWKILFSGEQLFFLQLVKCVFSGYFNHNFMSFIQLAREFRIVIRKTKEKYASNIYWRWNNPIMRRI